MIERVLAALSGDLDEDTFRELFATATAEERAPLALYTALATRAVVLGRIDLTRAVLEGPKTPAPLRAAAALAMPRDDVPTKDVVRRLLAETDPWARLQALERLAQAPDERSVDDLVSLLDDDTTVFDLWKGVRVAHAAARALLAAGRRDRLERFISAQRLAMQRPVHDLERHFAVLFLVDAGDAEAKNEIERLAKTDDPFGEYADALGVWTSQDR